MPTPVYEISECLRTYGLLLNDGLEVRVVEVSVELHVGLSVRLPLGLDLSGLIEVLEGAILVLLVSESDGLEVVLEAGLLVVSVEDSDCSVELVEENLDESSVAAGAVGEVGLSLLVVALEESGYTEVLVESGAGAGVRGLWLWSKLS